MLSVACLVLLIGEGAVIDGGGATVRDAGPPDGGFPCNGSEPGCVGPAEVATCQNGEHVPIDCRSLPLQGALGAQCGTVPGGEPTCLMPAGGDCSSLPIVLGHTLPCLGADPGCLSQEGSSMCVEGLGACTAGEVGTCRGSRAVLRCYYAQPHLLECASYRAGCQGGACVDAPEGQPCWAPTLLCAVGLECQMSRCTKPDTGVPAEAGAPDAPGSPDAPGGPDDGGWRRDSLADGSGASVPPDGGDDERGADAGCACATAPGDHALPIGPYLLLVVGLVVGRSTLRGERKRGRAR